MKTTVPEAVFNVVAGFRLKEEALAQVFSVEFCKISINTYSYRTLLVAAFAFFCIYEPVFFSPFSTLTAKIQLNLLLLGLSDDLFVYI